QIGMIDAMYSWTGRVVVADVMNPVADDVVIGSGVIAVVDSGATVAGATGRLDVMDVIPDNAGKSPFVVDAECTATREVEYLDLHVISLAPPGRGIARLG